ncbi:hypothetical protein TR75_04780 [Hydrogenibacillus schlegelii]|uniref:Putative NAD(P)H nitroreductase n=1 Tax=Hydrogenibacillus schlegelii TaxID=1484 RepID=A0A132N9Z0_HYDSH|nr:nitroreductase [Hydrogenibacillus schlegelii]KWX06816.1 hypothetical protein TR75_04780 [Hydrogenibacillus schlegelii]OAR04686.1 hypothetical protein SA87_09180 [Hydrogenibacillus schlegelii]PTQ54926.1 MAG: Nitroreductase [Hydrogenibacillus schlegelii]
MDVLEAIRTRRSIGRVKPDPVEREKIERILEAATWAPTHHRTEPWRFFVLTGEGRRPLSRLFVELAKAEMVDPETPENREKLEREAKKPFRAPVVIAVAVVPTERPDVVLAEERAAVAAAIQNMLLAAHALGLGAMWRTGKKTYHPKVRDFFGLGEKGEIVGFVYLGYPDGPPPERTRTPFWEKTKWIDEDRPYADG